MCPSNFNTLLSTYECQWLVNEMSYGQGILSTITLGATPETRLYLIVFDSSEKNYKNNREQMNNDASTGWTDLNLFFQKTETDRPWNWIYFAFFCHLIFRTSDQTHQNKLLSRQPATQPILCFKDFVCSSKSRFKWHRSCHFFARIKDNKNGQVSEADADWFDTFMCQFYVNCGMLRVSLPTEMLALHSNV